MIPQDFIQELLSRVDCVDVVGRYVQLKKAGANFLGLCPFHGEKSPSFTVSPTKQFYHCFGCGAHGSAIGFMIEYAGLSFPEAVRELAQGVGLTVPETRGDPAEAARRDPDLLELMAMLTKFYRSRLKDSQRAIAYLKKRGLSGETAARYGIGYAPDQWRGLEAAVPDYEAQGLAVTGMVIESEGDDGRKKRFDRFRDRIMFPIRNPRGQVIGFGGRVIDHGEPKYMNSPETPLFSKGRELYGMFEARDAMRRANCAVVVEGYMDVVMLAQHGVGHAVATLGTATTPDHVRKLLRMVDRVVFAFDGDSAGRKAAWRALEACLPMVADTKRLDFLFLPPEHDPDTYVQEHGPEGFERLLGEAQPLSEFLLRALSERVDMETPEGRARFLADARPLLLALPPAALRMQLVHRVAESGRVSTTELQGYLQQGAAEAARRQQAQAGRGAAGGRGTGGGGQPSGAGTDARPSGRPGGHDDHVGDPGPWSDDPAAQGWGQDEGWSGGGGEPDWGVGAGGDGGYASGGAGQGGYGQGGYGQGGYGPGGGRPGFARKGGRSGPWQGKGSGAWQGKGKGDWRRQDQPAGPPGVYPMRGQARLPDLQRRIRLLSALHPALAQGDFSPDFLPPALLDWLALLRELPAGANFAGLCEALRGHQPETVAELERDAAEGRAMVIEMTLDDARMEFEGALGQLRDKAIKAEIAALVGKGTLDEPDRARLKTLQSLRVKA